MLEIWLMDTVLEARVWHAFQLYAQVRYEFVGDVT